MSYVLRLEQLVRDGSHWASGSYLKSYDPAPHPNSPTYDGGRLDLTKDPLKARRFRSHEEAIRLWRTQAPVPYSLRQDGQPNRPLTAFTVSICPLEDAE